MKNARIIVTGISGLVGNHLIQRFDPEYHIIGLSRSAGKMTFPHNVSFQLLDISDIKALTSFLDATDFSTIINCAALTDVDICETEHELARKINVEAPSAMADLCRRKNSLLIHLSTDYIFDGKDGPYPEEAKPNPINYYGQTKLDAEKAVVASGCQNIIVRTNHLYGNLPSGPSRLVNWVLEAKDHPIKAAGDQFNNSTWAGNLADCIIELMKNPYHGIINVGGPDYLSRYEFAIRGADIFGIAKSRIIKVPIAELGMKAPRPPKAGLTIDKMMLILKIVPTGVSGGLEKVRARVM